MRENLLIAKEELIERWVAAFDEQTGFETYAAQTVTTKYAQAFSYNLSGYKNGKIPPGSSLFDEPHADDSSYGKYGFNRDGFLTTAEIYNKHELSHIGFFKKTAHLIEYIEFYLPKNVPSSFQRFFFENGKKTMLQSVFSNGRSGLYFESGTTLKEKVSVAFNGGYTAVCTIEQYEYANEFISRAYGLNIMPGIGQYFYENQYNYEVKKLANIKTIYEDGRCSFSYVAPSAQSLQVIIKELSELFCDVLISTLKEQSFDSPLFSVELSYRQCDNYVPHLVVLTARKKNEVIAAGGQNIFINGEFIYTTNIPDNLDKLYVEFYNRIETKNNWNTGRKMLIETAKLLTASRLKGALPVTEDFIAFPMDWELEGHTIKKVLLQCGASKINVRQWEEYGWF
ncbi:hypothetical protein ACFFGT_21335 [Mucilaginibacter angelicae]|uniref:Uncharacterized protein n=1 Tax=Mucilaginibacter angelicae TaxID=869718 RepID=A0ABV6LBJ0_9SPHI